MGNMKNASVLAKRTEEENSKKKGIQDKAKEHVTKFQDVSKACSPGGRIVFNSVLLLILPLKMLITRASETLALDLAAGPPLIYSC